MRNISWNSFAFHFISSHGTWNPKSHRDYREPKGFNFMRVLKPWEILSKSAFLLHSGLAEAYPDFCKLDADPGPCMGYFRKYYFDQHEGKCKEFIYGGCSGNKNNFQTIGECQSTCGGKWTLRWNYKSHRGINIWAGWHDNVEFLQNLIGIVFCKRHLKATVREDSTGTLIFDKD